MKNRNKVIHTPKQGYTVLALVECPHGTRAVTCDVGASGVSTRLTGPKCCGSWTTVETWRVDACDLMSVAREATLEERHRPTPCVPLHFWSAPIDGKIISVRKEGRYVLSRAHRGWRLRLHHSEGRNTWYRNNRTECEAVADLTAALVEAHGLAHVLRMER